MTVFADGQVRFTGDMEGDALPVHIVEATFRCDSCGRLSVGAYEGTGRTTPDREALSDFFGHTNPGVWAPVYPGGQYLPGVPRHIAAAVDEAFRSQSVGNRMAAVLMARTVIEATAKFQGIDGGNLFQKIDEMHKKNLIQSLTADIAHTIRLFGNDMAHGDVERSVDEVDVETVLDFMQAVLVEVFQTPARLQNLKSRVAARKAGQGQ